MLKFKGKQSGLEVYVVYKKYLWNVRTLFRSRMMEQDTMCGRLRWPQWFSPPRIHRIM